MRDHCVGGNAAVIATGKTLSGPDDTVGDSFLCNYEITPDAVYAKILFLEDRCIGVENEILNVA